MGIGEIFEFEKTGRFDPEQGARKTKIHYIQLGHNRIKCKPYVSKAAIQEESTRQDYRLVTCLKCIAAMSPGEQMWHNKNNSAWISHKAKDRRRKG